MFRSLINKISSREDIQGQLHEIIKLLDFFLIFVYAYYWYEDIDYSRNGLEICYLHVSDNSYIWRFEKSTRAAICLRFARLSPTSRLGWALEFVPRMLLQGVREI